MPVKATEAEVLSYFDKLSNWGRWGDDDELGAVNLITPEKRKQALALVTEGVTVTCARPVNKSVAAHSVRSRASCTSCPIAASGGEDVKQAEGIFQFSTDFIGFNFHGHSITHLDALSHIFWNGMSYNGFSAAKCTTNLGALVDSIAVLREGVTTRGVLLDIPRLKGVKWLEKEPGIFPEDLDAAEAAANLRVEPGDLLFVRTGSYRQHLEESVDAAEPNRGGFQAACLPWIRERDIAVLGSDVAQDIVPSGYPRVAMPVHQVAITAMGVWIIDNANLEELAEACAQRNRWEFLITVNPLPLEGATGCPVNPIAIF